MDVLSVSNLLPQSNDVMISGELHNPIEPVIHGEFSNPSLNPQSGITQTLKDINSNSPEGEVTTFQGVNISKKWKRRAREQAGKMRPDFQIQTSILGQKRDNVISIEESSREDSRMGKKQVIDKLDNSLKLPLSAEIATQSAGNNELYSLECSWAWEPTSFPRITTAYSRKADLSLIPV